MARLKGYRFPVRLSVSIEPADHAALSKLASKLDLSAVWFFRKAVAEFVECNCYDLRASYRWLVVLNTRVNDDVDTANAQPPA